MIWSDLHSDMQGNIAHIAVQQKCCITSKSEIPCRVVGFKDLPEPRESGGTGEQCYPELFIQSYNAKTEIRKMGHTMCLAL